MAPKFFVLIEPQGSVKSTHAAVIAASDSADQQKAA